MGRPSAMHEEENRKLVAGMHADGAPRAEIAEHFDVHVDTVGSWLQRGDIKALVDRILRDRTARILRKVDTKIEGILQHIEKLSLDDLLKIRKEFLPDRKEIIVGQMSREDLVAQLWERAAENPDAAAALFGDADEAA